VRGRVRLSKIGNARLRKALSFPAITALRCSPFRGFIDEVIEPALTRPKLIRARALLENKRDTNPPEKHGHIPL
jgi:acetyl-CoA carboxylase carboxyltransferase component